jgi:hypothetical protein
MVQATSRVGPPLSDGDAGRQAGLRVAELLIGSVSHELSHHCKRPVLLISGKKAGVGREPGAAGARESLAAKQEALAAIEEAPPA